MTVTADMIGNRLDKYVRVADESVRVARGAGVSWVEAKMDFERAYFRALTASEGKSQAAKVGEAEAATLDEKQVMLLAEVEYKAAQEGVKTAREVVAAVRSWASAQKTEWEINRG